MFRQVVYFQRNSNIWGGLSSMFFTLGICLISLGLLILVYPEVLAAMAASLLILSGVLFLTFAWKDWQTKRGYDKLRDGY